MPWAWELRMRRFLEFSGYIAYHVETDHIILYAPSFLPYIFCSFFTAITSWMASFQSRLSVWLHLTCTPSLFSLRSGLVLLFFFLPLKTCIFPGLKKGVGQILNWPKDMYFLVSNNSYFFLLKIYSIKSQILFKDLTAPEGHCCFYRTFWWLLLQFKVWQPCGIPAGRGGKRTGFHTQGKTAKCRVSTIELTSGNWGLTGGALESPVLWSSWWAWEHFAERS